jgi:DNA-binding Xre family transcriptional regulator
MILSGKQGGGRVKSRLKEIVARKEQVEGRRIPQKEIVEETGINANTVSRWMSPEPIQRVEESVVVPLCRWLGVQLGDLIYIDFDAK